MCYLRTAGFSIFIFPERQSVNQWINQASAFGKNWKLGFLRSCNPKSTEQVSGCLCIAAWSQGLPWNYLARTHFSSIFVRPLFRRLICNSNCTNCLSLASSPVFVFLYIVTADPEWLQSDKVSQSSTFDNVQSLRQCFSMRSRRQRLEAHKHGRTDFNMCRTPRTHTPHTFYWWAENHQTKSNWSRFWCFWKSVF